MLKGPPRPDIEKIAVEYYAKVAPEHLTHARIHDPTDELIKLIALRGYTEALNWSLECQKYYTLYALIKRLVKHIMDAARSLRGRQ